MTILIINPQWIIHRLVIKKNIKKFNNEIPHCLEGKNNGHSDFEN
jgi:hypothetical protein